MEHNLSVIDYKGWSLYDKIALVIRKVNHSIYELPQAYLVDPTNKKQLDKAIYWGTMNKYKLNKKTNKNEIEIVEPEVIYTENKGFKITLLDTARDSYQGGKLSFWNCIIEKKSDNIKCVIGINANLLLTLLIQNKFLYGTCENEVFFARQSGGVGLLTKDMIEYTEALKDMQNKKDINKGKTKNWKIGYEYITLTTDSLFLGKIYRVIDIDYSWGYAGSRNIRKIAIVESKEKESYVTYDLLAAKSTLESKYKSKHKEYIESEVKAIEAYKLSTLFEYWNNYIDSEFKKLKKEDLQDDKLNNKINDIISNILIFGYHGNMLNKLPARQEKGKLLDVDIDINEAYDSLIKNIQNKVLQYIKKGFNPSSGLVTKLIIRTSPFNFKDLTQNELKIIEAIKEEYLDKSILYK